MVGKIEGGFVILCWNYGGEFLFGEGVDDVWDVVLIDCV